MSCLGERLTALVDGELGHEERDRALAHLAGCAQCRDEVAWRRRLKGRLRDLSDVPVADSAGEMPSDDFLTRLRSLPASAGPPDGDVPPGPPPGAAARTPAGRPARPRRSAARPPVGAGGARPAGHAAALPAQPRRRYLMVGAATLFIGLGTASYAAGGRTDAPSITPDFDRFTVEHALTAGDAPLTDPLTEPLNEPLTGPVTPVPVRPGP